MSRMCAPFGLLGLLLASLPARATDPTLIDFERDIRPIFSTACVSCHGSTKQRGGLRLDDPAALMTGGNSGPVIVPGKSSDSRLMQLVAGLDPDQKMPPKGAPLSRTDASKLRAWIDQGAKWTTAGTATSGGPQQSTHWAYQPVRRPPLPPVKQSGWVRNEIDAFILARLDQAGLTPSAEADKLTLMRRLCLDLIGLPPTPDEINSYLADPRPNAYERLVDRLLASPHYGERWGRHWLDLARYADSDGFEKDTGRPHAWRYRQWVIQAINQNMPFDQFTIEQLAGDLLPGATAQQKTATGFHRNTLTNKEGGVDQEQFRVEAVVDRVNTTAKVFLGSTLGCCQCHDHKYDPFAQREYYQFFAFFNSDVEVDLPAPQAGEEVVYQRAKAAFDAKQAELDAAVNAASKDLPDRVALWEAHLTQERAAKLPAAIQAVLEVAPIKRKAQQKKVLTDHLGQQDPKLVVLIKAATEHRKQAPTPPLAQTLALGKPRTTHVLIRGDFLRPGVEVEPATPAVLPSIKPQAGKPTRLDLARWLLSPKNPLTSRVIVNWVWHKYFTRGLVATLEDFGTQGEKPSHPELVDWLASEFIRLHWDSKALHKLIVTSATYRQSSAERDNGLRALDPINVLLSRQHRPRLEAEVIRDCALSASGLLNRSVGGASVRPPQPAGISELTYAGSARWVESRGSDRNRRGLYTWFQRTSPYPMLMTFDAPDSNVCCVRRERSNTPLQALTLLNDTVFVECAQALGQRIVTEAPPEVSERLRHGFRLCLVREPSDDELPVLAGLYQDLLRQCRAKPSEVAKLLGQNKPTGDPVEAAVWVAMARALLNLDEFVTRE